MKTWITGAAAGLALAMAGVGAFAVGGGFGQHPDAKQCEAAWGRFADSLIAATAAGKPDPPRARPESCKGLPDSKLQEIADRTLVSRLPAATAAAYASIGH